MKRPSADDSDPGREPVAADGPCDVSGDVSGGVSGGLPGGLLSEILSAEDRDHCPGARPIVSVSDQDDSGYLADVRSRSARRVGLSRRGAWHGEWAELGRPEIRGRPLEETLDSAQLTSRWHAARPIVLPGIAAGDVENHADAIRAAEARHGSLKEAGGLKRWLDARAADLEPQFERLDRRAALFDRERDIERWRFESHSPFATGRGSRGKRVRDLWVKSSWLSTHEDDDSLRVRVSFGREERDDASSDLLRHRLVARLASVLLPESELIEFNPVLVRFIERCIAERPLFTQHIAYWNSPEGGALFHHDAFAAEAGAPSEMGQLGVCYLQLSGSTAWMALSIADLALRVREFAESLGEGDLPWVRAQLFPDAASWRRFEDLVANSAALLFELGLPGCGALGPLVNRGPEFTSFLADAGHAWILDPGDAILLPNHGIERTAMHSVFCAGDETAYSLSLAIRPDRE